jgi:hypothetical protein
MINLGTEYQARPGLVNRLEERPQLKALVVQAEVLGKAICEVFEPNDESLFGVQCLPESTAVHLFHFLKLNLDLLKKFEVHHTLLEGRLYLGI